MYNFDNSIYRIIFILLRAGLNWTTIPHADGKACNKETFEDIRERLNGGNKDE